MGETAARKRSRQESGVPWTPGRAPLQGMGWGQDTWDSAGGWQSGGGRVMNAPGTTRCWTGAGSREGEEAESLRPRQLQCPRWSKGEGEQGRPHRYGPGRCISSWVMLAPVGGHVCKCLCLVVGGGWGHASLPTGRGPFAAGTIASGSDDAAGFVVRPPGVTNWVFSGK